MLIQSIKEAAQEMDPKAKLGQLKNTWFGTDNANDLHSV